MKKALIFTTALVLLASPVMAGTVYLDKMDKDLNDWWNALDAVCRGKPGGSEESNLACDQRLKVDKIIEKKGCWNIYPATGPHDTSYWKCRK